MAQETLAQKVRAKYPSVYDDLTDTQLEGAIRAKYPGVYDDVPRTPATRQAQLVGAVGDIERGEAERTRHGREFLTGVGKSVWGTVQGGGQILRQKAPWLAQGPELQVPFTAEPNTPSERAGKTVGNLAQFFLPVSAVGKTKLALKTGQGLLDAILGASLEGTAAASVEAAQKGSTAQFGRTTALAGGTSLGLQGVFKGAGWLGERIERALVKPTQADVRNGFQTANIFRYRLGGSLRQTYDKTQQRLDELTGQLQDILKRPGPTGQIPQVDVLQALTDTAVDLQRASARTFGQNQALERATAKLLDDPLFQQMPSGSVDVGVANQVKQAVGEMGAWLHDPSGRVLVDPESRAMEKVANLFYDKLKTRIAAAAQGPVAAVNRQLSDILPIKYAIIRRIPVESRANVLNLGDIVGFSTGAWGLALLNRVLKSGQTANVLTAAERTAPTAGPLGAATTGAVVSQMTP